MPTVIAPACAIVSWDRASGDSMACAVTGWAGNWCVAISTNPAWIAVATAGGCLGANTHSMFARIVARRLLLAVRTLIAIIAKTRTIVVCQFASGHSVAAARVTTRNLILTVLTIVSMVAVALTIIIHQISQDGSTATARHCARFLDLAVVANVIRVAVTAAVVVVKGIPRSSWIAVS